MATTWAYGGIGLYGSYMDIGLGVPTSWRASGGLIYDERMLRYQSTGLLDLHCAQTF